MTLRIIIDPTTGIVIITILFFTTAMVTWIIRTVRETRREKIEVVIRPKPGDRQREEEHTHE